MRRLPSQITLAIALVAVAAGAAAIARAEFTQKGNLRIAVTAQMRPRHLPRTDTSPIAVSVAGHVTTTDESRPPQLNALSIEINRHGRLEYAGLPVCQINQIQPASNGRALAACRSSLVGKGKYFGELTLPGSAPYAIEGQMLVFNGREHGHQVLLGHIFSARPFATSFVIRFQITTSRHGAYGTVLSANLIKTLGRKRNLTGIEMTLSRRYSYRGHKRSYLSAACPAPKGVGVVDFPLARASFSFAGGARLSQTVTRSCRVRG